MGRGLGQKYNVKYTGAGGIEYPWYIQEYIPLLYTFHSYVPFSFSAHCPRGKHLTSLSLFLSLLNPIIRFLFAIAAPSRPYLCVSHLLLHVCYHQYMPTYPLYIYMMHPHGTHPPPCLCKRCPHISLFLYLILKSFPINQLNNIFLLRHTYTDIQI